MCMAIVVSIRHKRITFSHTFCGIFDEIPSARYVNRGEKFPEIFISGQSSCRSIPSLAAPCSSSICIFTQTQKKIVIDCSTIQIVWILLSFRVFFPCHHKAYRIRPCCDAMSSYQTNTNIGHYSAFTDDRFGWAMPKNVSFPLRLSPTICNHMPYRPDDILWQW